MTTIAYSLPHNQIAADGLECWGDMVARTDVKKIIVANRVIYALSGANGILDQLIEWEKAGAKGPSPPCASDVHWTFLVIKAGARVSYSSKFPYSSPMPEIFAIGSGGDHAIGALAAGKTPRQAVELVRDKRLDVWTGGEIQVVDIAKALGLTVPEEPTYVPHPDKPGKFLVKAPKREKAA